MKLNEFIKQEYIKLGWKNSGKDVFGIWLSLPLKEKFTMIAKQFNRSF